MTKFTEELAKELCQLYASGLPLSSCADFVGVHRTTVYHWLRRGKESKRRNKYKTFSEDWEKAGVKFELYHLKKIHEAKDWRASQYLLSVKKPDVYNVQNWHKVDSEVRVKKVVDEFDESEIRDAIRYNDDDV